MTEVMLKVKREKDTKNIRQSKVSEFHAISIGQLRPGDIFKMNNKLYRATAMPHVEKGEWDIVADFIKEV